MTEPSTEITVDSKKPLSNLKITLIALLAGAISFVLLSVLNSYYRKTVTDKVLESDTVKKADKDTRDAVESSIQEIQQFFEDAKGKVPEFVDKTLGIKSKFYAASEYIPFVEDGKSQKYISDCFEETIFSNQKITSAIEDAIRNYFKQVEDIENLMLYNLADDLPDFNMGNTHELPFDSLLEQFKKQQNDLVSQLTGISYQETAGSVINFVVTEILTAIATRLIVSSGILAVSGGTAVETFGASIVIGIVIDALFSFAWDKIKDPRGTLITIMNEELDKTEKLIIDGNIEMITDGNDKKWVGLRSYLENQNDIRNAQRREILRDILLSPSDISGK